MTSRIPHVLAPIVVVLLSACNGSDGGGGGGTLAPAATGVQSGPNSEIQSNNWSGYVQTGIPLSFNRVSGSWTVPAVSCGTNSSTASSSWVGIGGFNSTDPLLIQAGTEQDCNNGPSYFAWWEILPLLFPEMQAGSGLLDSGTFNVRAGDRITVDIDGSGLLLWKISIQNVTEGWNFNTTVPYVSGGDSAEWIMEAPTATGTGSIITLANFGTIDFSGLTANGANPQLTADQRIVMVDSNGHVLASPSAPGRDGASFRDCYGSGGC